jgi:ornithine cyclodeaminase/alanine dehydrogenase
MTLLLSDDVVRSVFDWRQAVEVLRAAYAGDADEVRFPGRTMARGDQGWLRTLSGVPAGSGVMGAKLADAGLEPGIDPFREFFIGRNPA